MIAVALGIFMTGGMIALFVSSSQSYRVQENLSRVQENGHFAINFLTQDIRMADYWGCLNSSVGIANNLNPGSGFDDFANAITATNGALGAPDSITIKRAAPSDIYIDSVPATVSADLKVTPNSGLAENDIVLVSDCSAGDILQITNLNTSNSSFDNIVHNLGGSPSSGDPDYPGNAEKTLEKKYGPDAQVYKMVYITYTIATGAGGQEALYRSINGSAPQELIEGIEDMQLKYGVDTDADNTPNFYVDSTGLTAAQMNQVVSVRVSLVARTLENNLSTQAVPYTVFGVTTTPPVTDRRIRRVFNTTIAIRNRLP
jgi:type IV pilus assembly protein PilW